MTTKLAKEILESLSTGSSEERIAFTERVSPTKMEVLGITMPYLKEVLKKQNLEQKILEVIQVVLITETT